MSLLAKWLEEDLETDHKLGIKHGVSTFGIECIQCAMDGSYLHPHSREEAKAIRRMQREA